MQEHISGTGRDPFAVDDVIVEIAVADEQTGNDQERQEGKIEGIKIKWPFKINGDADDHLSEGKYNKKHNAFRQVLEVDREDRINISGGQDEKKTGYDRNPGKREMQNAIERNRSKNDSGLDQEHQNMPL